MQRTGLDSSDCSFTSLCLVRHGQAASSDGSYGPETHLSRLGRRQAQLVAGTIGRSARVTAIYTSPFPRAVETAEPIGRRLGMEIVKEPRLSEFQVGTSQKSQLGSKQYLSIWKPEHTGMQGGETVQEFFVRIGQFCEEICNRHRNQTIVLVTHAGAIGAIYRWAMGIPSNVPWTFDIEVENGSISEIEMWPQGRVEGGPLHNAFLRRMGDVSHLGKHRTDI